MGSTVTRKAKKQGRPVRDAVDSIVLNTNTSDIGKAVRMEKRFCVLARCAERVIRTAIKAEVGRSVAYIHYSTHVDRFILSSDSMRYLRSFDAGEKVKPGSFELLVPTGSKALSNVQKRCVKMRKDLRKRHDKGALGTKPKRQLQLNPSVHLRVGF